MSHKTIFVAAAAVATACLTGCPKPEPAETIPDAGASPKELAVLSHGFGRAAPVLDVRVSGTHLFVAAGPAGLLVVSIADPATPRLVATLDTPGAANGLDLVGDTLFVADGPEGLLLVDVSTPESPAIIRSVRYSAGGGDARDVRVQGDYVYVADAELGLAMLHPATRLEVLSSAPHEQRQNEKLKGARSIEVVGDAICISTDRAVLIVRKHPDNATLTTLDENGLSPSPADGLFALDSTVYVTSQSLGLALFDPTPAAPRFIGSIALRGSPAAVFVDGTTAYVAAAGRPGEDYAWGGLHVVDLVDPSAPVLRGTLELQGFGSAVAAAAGHAFVGVRSGVLYSAALAPPEAPQLAGTLFTGSSVQRVFISGDTAFIAAGESGMVAADVSDPAAPRFLSLTFVKHPVLDVQVRDGRAYLAADRRGMLVLDVSRPEAPVRLGEVATRSDVRSIALSGDRAFLAGGFKGGSSVVFEAIDIADPAAMRVLGSLESNHQGVAVALAREGLAILSTGNLEFLDVSDPAQPKVLGKVERVAGRPVIVGHHAFTLDGGNLTRTNFLDPARPFAEGIGVLGGNELALDGTTLYAAGDDLLRMDLSDPESGLIVQRAELLELPAPALALTGVDGLLYLCGGDEGLTIGRPPQ